MNSFLLQTLVLISYLVSLFIIIHFLFSKEGGYWIVPLLLNIFFVSLQGSIIIDNNGGQLPFDNKILEDLPIYFTTNAGYYIFLIISLLWLFMVLTMHYGIGKNKKPVEKRKQMMKKNYYGALYTEKIEKREFKNRKKSRELHKLYGAKSPSVTQYSKEWIDSFDKT